MSLLNRILHMSVGESMIIFIAALIIFAITCLIVSGIKYKSIGDMTFAYFIIFAIVSAISIVFNSGFILLISIISLFLLMFVTEKIFNRNER